MLVDPNAPFFDKLWVRVACVVLPLIWAGVEFYNAAPFWGSLSGAAGLYLAYQLFLRRTPD